MSQPFAATVLGAFAEFERALIRERQLEGIALARARGAYTGRKPSLTAGQPEALRARAAAGEAKAALAREFGISRQTLYSYLLLSAYLSAHESMINGNALS